jgi:hypothetical protein
VTQEVFDNPHACITSGLSWGWLVSVRVSAPVHQPLERIAGSKLERKAGTA